ncbi:hypothetical protein HYN69_07010 [Gemmobacter aquarius]|uniref:Uncharacterized protein n=1 Tax=Paragemmobacter aquarius TaxID=2169400 RepID=A0A2S0UKE3_9RHOB|nr:hypothetical protein [Gemmobacter aquarius]AWB48294.1 hypothetical protein HYN69_07010 [Gemmobacter aquarius]
MSGSQRRLTDEELAEVKRLADIASPYPNQNPVVTGIAGLAVVWFAAFVLLMVMGIDTEGLIVGRYWTLACVIGFLIGYSPIALKQRAHRRYYLSLLSAKKADVGR